MNMTTQWFKDLQENPENTDTDGIKEYFIMYSLLDIY